MKATNCNQKNCFNEMGLENAKVDLRKKDAFLMRKLTKNDHLK